MKSLPLYTDTRAVLEKADAIINVNRKCDRCRLSDGVRSVCMGADGQRPDEVDGFNGAVLILGDYPTEAEDAAHRPMSAGPNSTLRELVESTTDAPVVYATALRCAPKSRNVTDKMVEACRPYTRGLVDELKPSRILCFGKRAYQSVLGSKCDSIQLGRRGYGYLSDGTPVYMLHAARRVTPNHFLFKRWRADLEWALNGDLPQRPPWSGTILEVETVEDSERAAKALEDAGAFTFDTETGGLMGDHYFQVVCLTATAANDLETAYLWNEEALKDLSIRAPLVRVLADGRIRKCGHNLKFDFEAVGYGLGMRDDRGVLTVRGAGFDTMLTVRTIDTECKGALDHADHHVGMGGHKAENKAAVDAAVDVINRARAKATQSRLPGTTHPALEAAVRHPIASAKAFAYALVPRETLYRYCALDTIATARLEAMYAPIVEKTESLRRVRDTLHNPVTEAIAQIEAWGMSADIQAAHAFGRLLEPRREAAMRKIEALGCTVDINSSQQLGAYLFGDLGLPVQDVTDTGAPRVNAASLEKLREHHEVIPALLDYAKVNKLLGTYVTGLIPHIRPDGRIRASLNIAGARSGRMSSSNPNLQNIPSGGEYAKMAKAIFNAPPGHILLQLDYSQLEVRIVAALSGEPDLIQAYLDGADVHRRTAAKAFGVEESAVTKEQRRSAKAVVFGTLYGQGVGTLAKTLGVSYQAAQSISDSVLGAYPVLVEWMEERRRYANKYGTTWTYLSEPGFERARCRQLWQLGEPDSKQQSVARNAAVNTPVQGTASDFMLRTLVAVVEWITGDGIPARVTNTVHDSIILEVPVDWALEVAGVVKGIMESWPSGGVPLVADVDVGATWGSLMSLDGVRTVATAYRNGLTDDEVIHLCEAAPAVADEMADNPAEWVKRAKALADRIGA